LLLWTFLPSSDKETFKKKKPFFWLIVLFSLIPDGDIFLGIHRGFFHSILSPLFLILIGTIIHIYYTYLESNQAQRNDDNLKNDLRAFRGRTVLYAGFVWISHIMLDLEYPLAIFYPLSDRLYQINFVYLLNLIPWLFFPVMIVGAQFDITSVSYLRGITRFFVNLSPSERVDVFGTNIIAIPIEEFFLHLIIFIIFVIQVGKPMFPSINFTRYRTMKSKIVVDRLILLVGFSLIIIGLVMGPMTGTNIIDTSMVNSSYSISPSEFAPSVALAIEPTHFLLQPQTIMNINGVLNQSESSNFDHVLLLTTTKEYTNFSNHLSTLFKENPPNSPENVSTFTEGYESLLNDLYGTALAMNLTNKDQMSLTTQTLSDSLSLVGIIENWNNSMVLEGDEQRSSVKISINIKTSRLTLYLLGLGFIGTGLIVILLSVRLKNNNSNNE
jgi:hypothetical protein